MDSADPIILPRHPIDPLDADLAEVDAAIAMVQAGLADRVRLIGLHRPDAVVAVALAHAQAAGVRFELDRTGESPVLTFGPTD